MAVTSLGMAGDAFAQSADTEIVSVTANRSTAQEDDFVVWTVTVRNNGPDAATMRIGPVGSSRFTPQSVDSSDASETCTQPSANPAFPGCDIPLSAGEQQIFSLVDKVSGDLAEQAERKINGSALAPVSETDSTNNQRSGFITLTKRSSGGGGGTTGDQPGNPTISGVSFSGTPKSGLLIQLTLSEQARSVSFQLQRRVRGRKVRGKCKTKAKRGKRCRTWKKVKSLLTTPAQAGKQTFPIAARKTKSLKAGRYRIRIRVTDLAGNRSKYVYTRSFTVKPKKKKRN